MAPLVKELARRERGIESRVCVTGQHREMLDQVLELFDVRPDHDLAVMKANQSLAYLTGAIISGLDPVMADGGFDWVLVQGDTTTCMAAGLAAFYHKVRVGHVEAGLRTEDKYQPYPEEINRRITSVLADVHFAPTQWAADNLLAEGIPEDLIHVTGNTVIDALQDVASRPFDPAGTVLQQLPADKRLVLMTTHRRENFGSPIRDICRAVLALVHEFDDVHVVYPVHLNPNIRGPVFEFLGDHPAITLCDPLEYLPLVQLMKRSHLVLTDSGGIQEEAPGLGKPVLVLRNTTERPEGVDAGTVKLVGNTYERITAEARTLLSDPGAYGAMACAANPYGDGTAAKKIVGILESMG